MATQLKPDLDHILEHGHPDDAPARPSERIFIRALRREEEWAKGNYQVTHQVCQPITEAEVTNAKCVLRASGYADALHLLESALAEHDDHHGRINDRNSPHWSAKAHLLLETMRGSTVYSQALLEEAIAQAEADPVRGRRLPASSHPIPTQPDAGAKIMALCIGLLVLLTFIAGIRNA